MLKRLLLSGAALTVMSGIAMAQMAPPAANNEANTTSPATEMAAPPASGTAAPADSSQMSAQAESEDPNLFSNMSGAQVIGQNDENIGRVADVLVDGQGNVRQLVLGHGGVIGIGETLRVYDVSSLPVVQDDKVRLDQLTTASLESLPEFDYPESTETGRASTSGDAATATGAPAAAPAMGSGTTSSPEDRAAANAAPTGTSGAQNSDPASMPVPPASTADAGSGMAAPAASGQMWAASQLVGATITNADESAEIEDLRFAGNKIDRVVIDKGGVLGLGAEEREIAFADLQIGGDPAEPTITMNATAAGQVNTESTAPAAPAPAAQ
jgi:hypothetical protein